MGRIVGIDLGTTNSVIAVFEGGEPTVIPLADGSRLCPSVVGFSKSGERLVGQLAKRQAITHPDRTIASIKRHMGDADYRVAIDEKFLTPQEISAMILQKLKTDAEAYLGEPVDRAVITVPAYFSDTERQATKDAGRIAGLEVTRIINEPTAAALAYGMDKADVHTVLVWDLGGGTFDVSLLEVGDGVFEVKATNGDTHLGGDDWDERIVNWIAEAFLRHSNVDLRSDKVALQRLCEACEKAKIELSSVVTTAINLPFIGTNSEGPVHLEMDLTRAQLEALTDDLREKMLLPTRNALADAKLTPGEIDVVLLVGGSTRMPAVQQMVREMFGKEPHKGTNPDEVVALGAAVEAGILGGEIRDLILLDVTPLSLGIETVGGVATRLIARNTTIPTSVSQTFTTAADGQTAVDIHILQGEREFAAANKSIGRFQLRDIAPMQHGLPKIEVTFDIDANGIVNVSARDKATGREQRVTLTSDTGLSKSEIEQMVRDAASHAAEDSNRRDLQDARNAAESRLHSGDKTIGDAKSRVDAVLIDAAQNAAARLREALAATDASIIRQLGEVYSDAIFAVSTALYSHGGDTVASAPSNEPRSGAGDVAEAPEHEIPLEFTKSVLDGSARSASFEADPSVVTVVG